MKQPLLITLLLVLVLLPFVSASASISLDNPTNNTNISALMYSFEQLPPAWKTFTNATMTFTIHDTSPTESIACDVHDNGGHDVTLNYYTPDSRTDGINWTINPRGLHPGNNAWLFSCTGDEGSNFTTLFFLTVTDSCVGNITACNAYASCAYDAGLEGNINRCTNATDMNSCAQLNNYSGVVGVYDGYCVVYTNYNGTTSDYNATPIQNNPVLDITGTAKIAWSGIKNMFQANFDAYLTFASDNITNSDLLPTDAYSPANITFYNVSALNLNATPGLFIDGVECNSCERLSYNNNVLVFSVPTITNYTVGNGTHAASPPTPPVDMTTALLLIVIGLFSVQLFIVILITTVGGGIVEMGEKIINLLFILEAIALFTILLL